MYVCIYIYIYIYVCVIMCIYIYICVCVSACHCIYIYTYVIVYIDIYVIESQLKINWNQLKINWNQPIHIMQYPDDKKNTLKWIQKLLGGADTNQDPTLYTSLSLSLFLYPHGSLYIPSNPNGIPLLCISSLPSGKLTVCYWTWPLISWVFPLKNGGSFHINHHFPMVFPWKMVDFPIVLGPSIPLAEANVTPAAEIQSGRQLPWLGWGFYPLPWVGSGEENVQKISVTRYGNWIKPW